MGLIGEPGGASRKREHLGWTTRTDSNLTRETRMSKARGRKSEYLRNIK